MTPSIVALIPARAGSKRVPGKNTRLLAGKPLLAYTIEAAQQSGIFCDVAVSSDDERAWDICLHYSTHLIERPERLATDGSPDIDWVRHALEDYKADAFAILRPTSPFRTAETIRRAWEQFQVNQPCHSMRAVQPVKEHPGKMWQVLNGRLTPLIGREWPAAYEDYQGFKTRVDAPWHSQPTQMLPQVYVQNASLEIAWSYVVPAFDTISGNRIMAFFAEGDEGFDINTEADWMEAERRMLHQPVEYLG